MQPTMERRRDRRGRRQTEEREPELHPDCPECSQLRHDPKPLHFHMGECHLEEISRGRKVAHSPRDPLTREDPHSPGESKPEPAKSDVSWRCDICLTMNDKQMTFATHSSAKRHMSTHSHYTPMQCLFCGASFPNTWNRRRHMNARHGAQNRDRTPPLHPQPGVYGDRFYTRVLAEMPRRQFGYRMGRTVSLPPALSSMGVHPFNAIFPPPPPPNMRFAVNGPQGSAPMPASQDPYPVITQQEMVIQGDMVVFRRIPVTPVLFHDSGTMTQSSDLIGRPKTPLSPHDSRTLRKSSNGIGWPNIEQGLEEASQHAGNGCQVEVKDDTVRVKGLEWPVVHGQMEPQDDTFRVKGLTSQHDMQHEQVGVCVRAAPQEDEPLDLRIHSSR